MATVGSAKATLVNRIDSLTSSATAKDTIFLAKALKENSSLNNFVWQGNWAATTAYATDDVVSNGGNTYMCIVAHTSGTSFAVGSDWSIMASAGTDGASGIPSGGSVGQVVTNTGAGAGGWADAAAGGGITEADQWRVTALITSSQAITTNLERVDNPGFGKLGTGMSHTLGWWTFPSTGVWEVGLNFRFYIGSDDNVTSYIRISTDGGSTYSEGAYPGAGGTTGDYQNTAGRQLVDVTDTSNIKVQFYVSSIGSGSYAVGDTNDSNTYFTFIRLGDT